MSDLIHNEKVKHYANLANGLAVAVIVVGGLAPLVAMNPGTDTSHALLVIWLAVCCILVGFILHLIGRRSLERLRG